MIRNLKLLGVAVVAVIAVNAVGPAGTQAASFESAEAPVTIVSTPDGSGKTSHFVLDIAGASITCNVFSTSGDWTNKLISMIVLRLLGIECTFIGQTGTFSANGCAFEYSASGLLGIVCPAGKELTISVPNPVCDVAIPGQLNKGTVSYHNITTGTSKEITISSDVTNITHTATGAGCPVTGTFGNGALTTYNSNWTGQDHTGKTVNIEWKA